MTENQAVAFILNVLRQVFGLIHIEFEFIQRETAVNSLISGLLRLNWLTEDTLWSAIHLSSLHLLKWHLQGPA